VTPLEERTLASEVVVIGRSPEAHVQVLDPLVSRQHLRITVADSATIIEDLRSANGVYVNGARLNRSRPLYDGDRILIGTTELSVFAAPASESRPAAVRGQERFASKSLPPADDVMDPLLRRRTESATTARASAFDVLGRLADRMFAMGRGSEAEKILADHLTRVRGGARAGLEVPAALREEAARYALRLAQATGRLMWADFAVELHLLAGLPMSDPLFELLMGAGRVRDLDKKLFADYLAAMRRRLLHLSSDEQRRYARLHTFFEAAE
jgi:hypothetical protein